MDVRKLDLHYIGISRIGHQGEAEQMSGCPNTGLSTLR